MRVGPLDITKCILDIYYVTSQSSKIYRFYRQLDLTVQTVTQHKKG